MPWPAWNRTPHSEGLTAPLMAGCLSQTRGPGPKRRRSQPGLRPPPEKVIMEGDGMRAGARGPAMRPPLMSAQTSSAVE